MKGFFRKTIPVALGVILLSVGGAMASWSFAAQNAGETSSNVTLGMGSWAPADLPDEVEGADHTAVVEVVKQELEKNFDDSVVQQSLASRLQGNALFGWNATDVYGSMDPDRGNVIDDLLAEQTEMSFIIQAVGALEDPNNEYDTVYVFTTDVDLGTAGSWGSSGSSQFKVGDRVSPIYRTVMKKTVAEDGTTTWVAGETQVGSAEFSYYVKSWNSLGSVFTRNIPSFDADTWLPNIE